jgi:hypothetical protein
MSDDKTKTGQTERLRVNIHDRYEIEYWTKKWNVTPTQLVDAVNAVGPKAHLVARRLEKILEQTSAFQRRGTAS